MNRIPAAAVVIFASLCLSSCNGGSSSSPTTLPEQTVTQTVKVNAPSIGTRIVVRGGTPPLSDDDSINSYPTVAQVAAAIMTRPDSKTDKTLRDTFARTKGLYVDDKSYDAALKQVPEKAPGGYKDMFAQGGFGTSTAVVDQLPPPDTSDPNRKYIQIDVSRGWSISIDGGTQDMGSISIGFEMQRKSPGSPWKIKQLLKTTW